MVGNKYWVFIYEITNVEDRFVLSNNFKRTFIYIKVNNIIYSVKCSYFSLKKTFFLIINKNYNHSL